MRRVKPALPSDCEIVGALIGGSDAGVLSEDMIEVILPNGIMIAAGWCPDNAPEGQYRVTVLDGMEFLTEPVPILDIDATARFIEECVSRFRRPVINFSQTDSSSEAEEVCV